MDTPQTLPARSPRLPHGTRGFLLHRYFSKHHKTPRMNTSFEKRM